LVSKAGAAKADTSDLHIRGGEFVADEVEDLMDRDELVESACREIVEYTKDRQAVLIFAAGVKHAEHIQRTLQERHGQECGFVSGKTPTGMREELLARFRGDVSKDLLQSSPLKYLVNVGVLTTGFDAPRVDCVAILRPTMSPGLFYQLCGRGFRVHPGKQDCLVLDFGGNVLRHGPVDQIRVQEKMNGGTNGGDPPAKECPECHSVIAAGYSTCPDCGYQFPAREKANHDATASTEGVLSGQVVNEQYAVRDTFYNLHTKRGADEDAPKTMRVDYQVGWHEYKSEWVCFEHEGYARWKAEQWWRARSSDPVPETSQQAVDVANAGGLATTKAITVRTVTGEPFERVVDYELGEKPEPSPMMDLNMIPSDDVPF
jgi:DNA repair protein RadD